MSSTSHRYVPQGAVSLSSDAPGWSADASSFPRDNDSSGNTQHTVDGSDVSASTSGPGEKGPICWKCKGMGRLALRAQDILQSDISGNKVGKKKQKRLARKRATEDIGTTETSRRATSSATDAVQNDNKRTCPVCNGRGNLPIRSKFLQTLKKSTNDTPYGGTITSRRRRPSGWNEFGHVPGAVQAAERVGLASAVNTSTSNTLRQSLAFLSRANGTDDDYDSKRTDVSVQLPPLTKSPPSWLPTNPGEQLCNLVGRWRILQRVGSHRWTTDDLVTAYVAASTFVRHFQTENTPSTIRYLDLGTGNASVLQMTSWYLLSTLSSESSSLEAVGVEARSEAVGLARRSLSFNLGSVEYEGKTYTGRVDAKPSNNAATSMTKSVDSMHHNVQVVRGDFRDLTTLSQSTTSTSEASCEWNMEYVSSKQYDLITGTPPYFRVDFSAISTTEKGQNNQVITAVINQGAMPTSIQSAPARCEFRGGVEAYCQAASAMLKPNGMFVVCENWLNDNRVYIGAKEAGLVIDRVWPVMGKTGRKEPLFAVYVMKKQSSQNDSTGEVRTEVNPPLVVRGANGKWTEEYERVMEAMSIPVPIKQIPQTWQKGTKMLPIADFLLNKCGVCPSCIVSIVTEAGCEYLDSHNGITHQEGCTVCFGISSPAFQNDCIIPKMKESLRPYCQRPSSEGTTENVRLLDPNNGNFLTRESPTVSLPWLMAVRAHCAIAAAKWYILQQGGNDNTLTSAASLRTAEDVYTDIKERVKSELRDTLNKLSTPNGDLDHCDKIELPAQLHKEEAGYLGIHIIVLPPFIESSDSSSADIKSLVSTMVPTTLLHQLDANKHQIQQTHNRILNPRKRFRGNDPTQKQGGDPRQNLELRVRRMGEDATNSSENKQLGDWNTILSWLDTDTVQQWLANETSDKYLELATWLQKARSMNKQTCSVFTTVWRRPFHIHGMYTKSRRDVSQTPFYVPGLPKSTSDKSKMIRKGTSSVEEEICSPLSLSCGGISRRNNVTQNEAKGNDVVFGLCKFHASGREDMDVRMLLPPPSIASNSAKSNIVITGRPFVCEIFDAHRLPTKSDLDRAVHAINGTVDEGTEDGIYTKSEVESNEKGWPETAVDRNRSYGENPVSVSTLKYVPSSAFSGLQSETENKMKYYACVVHSCIPITSDDELVEKLGCLRWNHEDDVDEKSGSDNNCNYPLEIHQSTPLRVLHRRSSDVRVRHVLSLSACRIDDHWFRLRLSTSAGTYVKEFVHGDCGRSYPSVASMIGGRVDITELDCEGIAM